MALLKSLKVVTDAPWVISIISKAAGKHRCFTEYFKVQDATEQYVKVCGPLVENTVKTKSCFKSKKYIVSCLDTAKVTKEFIKEWFVFAPSIVNFIQREQKPILFINDIVEISSCSYNWDNTVSSLIRELIGSYNKTHSIYIDDTEPAYHVILENLGFRPVNAGGVTYWRFGGSL